MIFIRTSQQVGFEIIFYSGSRDSCSASHRFTRSEGQMQVGHCKRVIACHRFTKHNMNFGWSIIHEIKSESLLFIYFTQQARMPDDLPRPQENHGINGPYERVVSITASFTARMISLLFQRQRCSFLKARAALANRLSCQLKIHWYSACCPNMRTKSHIGGFFYSMVIRVFESWWNGDCSFTVLICLGVNHGWWITSVFEYR